jgi:hypothetical protein
VITIRTPLFLAMKDVAPLMRCERTRAHLTCPLYPSPTDP